LAEVKNLREEKKTLVNLNSDLKGRLAGVEALVSVVYK
jgi:hypothetical protein